MEIVSKVLSESYCRFYEEPLLPSSNIWQHVVTDSEESVEGSLIFSSPQDLIEHLRFYFAEEVIDRVHAGLTASARSISGPEYALRGTFSSIVKRILKDELDTLEQTKDVGDEAGEDGERSDDTAEWTVVERRRQPSKRGGRGRGGRGRGRAVAPGVHLGVRPRVHGGDALARQVQFFPGLEVVQVELPPFVTLSNGMSGHQKTITVRTREFSKHVKDFCGKVYDAHDSLTAEVNLYHGFRHSSFSSFQSQGISPPYNPNEFSRGAAFYVSNSIGHAFEHSLHQHISLTKSDYISVFQFSVSSRILHGEEPPAVGKPNFKVLWFPTADHKWRRFCHQNLKSVPYANNHSYDIVIGPLSLPGPYPESLPRDLRIKLPSGAKLTQIAFCSDESRAWLHSCAKRVFHECYTPV